MYQPVRAFSAATLAALVVLCALPSQASAQSGSFYYPFGTSGTLKEASSASVSSSPYFWLNSGAELRIANGEGSTVIGTLPSNSLFRLLYSLSNPLDTEDGYRPQNIFRLLTKSAWQNADTSAKISIVRLNATDTPNRDGYSGALLMARYKDGNNLYYAGIRQDGRAVIKKKIGGAYYTLAERAVFPGTYDRTTNPNLLPTGKWMGLKLSVINQSDGSARLALLYDADTTGIWTTLLTATDRGTGGPVLSSGSSGLRSDYFDLKMDDFRVVAR